jgi:hypothetical protein
MVVLTKDQEKLQQCIENHIRTTNPSSLFAYAPFIVDAPKFSLSDASFGELVKRIDPEGIVYVISIHTKDRLKSLGIKCRILSDDIEITAAGTYRRKEGVPSSSTVFILDGVFVNREIINILLHPISHVVIFGDTYLTSFYINTYFNRINYTLNSPDKDKCRSLIMKYLLGRIRRNELKLEDKNTSNYRIVDVGLSKPDPDVSDMMDSAEILELMSDHDITVVNNGYTQLVLNKYYREQKLGYLTYLPRAGEKMITHTSCALVLDDGTVSELPSGTIVNIMDVEETGASLKHFVIKVSVEIDCELIYGDINVNKEFLEANVNINVGHRVSTSGHLDGYLLSYCYAVGILQVFDREFDKVLIIFESNLHLNNVNSWLYTTANTVRDYLTILF